MKKQYLLSLFLFIVTCSCTTSTQNKEVFDFPDQAILTADISGNDQGISIQCSLQQYFTRSETQPFIDTVEAFVSGSAGRTAVDSEGAGVGFDALTADSVAIFSSPEWDIEIVSRNFDVDDNPSQFFEELLHYKGNKVGTNKWMGTWACYPFHTRGDSIGIITGTWEMEEGEWALE